MAERYTLAVATRSQRCRKFILTPKSPMPFQFATLLRNTFLLAVCLLATSSAWAQLEITIGKGTVRGVPIAIVPFKTFDGENFEHRIEDIIAFDLAASGKFEPIDKENFLAFPSSSDQVRHKDWRLIDAEILVIGELWRLGDDLYELQFRIFDVAREQETSLSARIPNIRQSTLRAAAHMVSDRVYQAFVGKRGDFSSRIAYVKKTEIEFQRYRYQLMVADWDGYNPREVYASSEPILSPNWSPDGSQIALVAFRQGGGSVIINIDLSSGQRQVIASSKGVNSAPAWSPNGRKIAYSSSRYGSADVFIYDVASKRQQRVNTHYAIDTEPAWSPDGRSLLFTSSRSRKPQIYEYDLRDETLERVTFEGDESANASYDRSGEKLVMVQNGGEIVLMQRDSGKITQLSNAEFDESPSFSPNGDMVLYATEHQYTPALVVVSADGRVRTHLEFVTGDVREPAWSP